MLEFAGTALGAGTELEILAEDIFCWRMKRGFIARFGIFPCARVTTSVVLASGFPVRTGLGRDPVRRGLFMEILTGGTPVASAGLIGRAVQFAGSVAL